MATSEAVVDAFLAAVQAKDVDAALALMADDVVYDNVPIGPMSGKDAVRATLEGFLAPTAGVDWQIRRQVAAGNVVVNERVDRFQMGNGWLELPVAGFFEVTDEGLIALWRDYFDMPTYMNQLTELMSGG